MIRYITDDLKFSSDDSDEFVEEFIKIKHHDGEFFRKEKLYVQNIRHFSLKQEVTSWKIFIVFLNIIYQRIYNTVSL